MRIRWTQPAARDLTNICDYIEGRDTPATARRIALLIYRSIDSLHKNNIVGKIGSAQESDRVPNWRGFQNFALSGEFGSSPVWSAMPVLRRGLTEIGPRAELPRSRVKLRSHRTP